MTPVRGNEVEILLSQSRDVFEQLISACVQSCGDLHLAENAMATAIDALRSYIITAATRVCVISYRAIESSIARIAAWL